MAITFFLGLPTPADAQTLPEAEQLLAEGRLEEARAAFRQLIAEDPLESNYHVGLGRVLIAAGDLQGASTVLLPTAVRWMETGRYAEAAELLEVAAEATPQSRRAWSLLGRAHALGRQYRAAEDPLRTAVELGDRHLMTLLLYGSTLWENGAVGEAERVFREALETKGGDRMLVEHQLASLWLWQGRFSEAIEPLRRVVTNRPEWVGARVDLARALQAEGLYEEARQLFEFYLSAVPDDAKARYGLASVLARLGEQQLAAEQMRISAELRERSRLTTMAEGRLQASLDEATFLLGRGELEEARTVLEAMPRSIEVLSLLSKVLSVQGDHAAAVQALEEAVAKDPSRADLRAELQALYLAGEATQ